MPTTIDSSSTFCYGKSRNLRDSDINENTKIFKTKVDLLNCKPEDVTLKMEGNRVIIEGKLFNDNYNEKPTHFSKHYIMPENCDLKKMRYTITSDGVYITAPKRSVEDFSSEFPKLEDSCTNNCVDLNDRFEIRLNVQDYKPEDIKIKVNGNTIIIKAKRLQETGMKRVIKTYSLPESCEITKLERRFTPQGYLILSIPKFLGLFCDPKKANSKFDENKIDNVKCKFNITTEKFEIKIDVSNYRPEDINIIQQKRMVTIEGKSVKKFCKTEEKFEKTFVLPPDYDVSKIDRKFHSDGVLVVSVPRIEGKVIEDFKTFLPENSICDMKIKDEYVEIKLDIVGFEPEEITIKLTGKNTITIEGKQPNQKGRIAKSFMKSYLLPTDCDTKRIKKTITSNGVLIVRVPRIKRTCSLENLSEIDDKRSFSSRSKSGSLDNLSEPDEQALMDSAELDKEKFEMKFNVHGFSTEDVYVKINKNIVTVECKHSKPGKGIVKSYLVPKAFNLNALHTYITHDDILVVTIPRHNSQSHDHINRNTSNNSRSSGNNIKRNNSGDTRDTYNNDIGHIAQKVGDNYVIKVDIRGYNNNDISLDIKGNTVIVQGDHLGMQTIARSFSKKFMVPSDYNVEALTYYISAGGFIIIEIPRKLVPNGVGTQLYTFPEEKTLDSPQPFHNPLYKQMNPLQNKYIPNRHSDIPINGHQYSRQQIMDVPDRLSHNGYFKSTPDMRQTPIDNPIKHRFASSFDANGNEIYQVFVDVRNCYEEDINVRILGNTFRVEGKMKYFDEISNPSGHFLKSFSVPEDFDMNGLQTKLESGILVVEVPKYDFERKSVGENSYKGKDLLSNVKIGRDNILVEMDASGLRIEDFEITTSRNVLTIEVLKGDSDKLKTKVELPEDAIIDNITKSITSDGKLLVKVPRKIQENLMIIPSDESAAIREDYDQLAKNQKRRSCLVLSKNETEKTKSVKFLVDDFENESDEAVKFATLPRSTRCKSYNSVFLEDQADRQVKNMMVTGNFELKIHVPYHEPDEVIVKIRGSTITIEGKKKNDVRNSYFSKNFFKTYLVPKNIDTSQLKTTFIDNYLLITAPRTD